MSGHRALAVAGLLAFLTTSPAFAQEDEGRGVVVFAQGGGFSPLTHLDDLGSTDFKTGFNVGGGVAYQVNRYVAVRGNFTFARAEARYTGVGTINDIAGTKFNRLVYDADVQLRYPLKGGAAPYVFVGGGAVTVKQDVTPNQPSFTKGAGKVGVGLSYRIPRSNVGLYVEGAGWLYTWDRNGFDKTQFDTTWSGGISYRFGG